ncbi:hypothetical protein [Roseimaritima ulvae]|uniref:Uncharacterized protein n=1 Tax=Roseimaritima ulvae TaxID=980254 RepID=A0A5B9R3V7_9BACT|nr:hypothetical protein [Roseimaritima ulvae]QEG41061.1 hypothetical protein UC8_30790 [Roseimaritima ulvae]
MTNSQRLAAVRQTLRAWYQEQQPEAPWEVAESIMIRDGFYCGRNFRFGTLRAVWFVEEEQVKIYQADGSLLHAFKTDVLETGEPTVKLFEADGEESSEPETSVEQTPAAEEAPARRAA